MNYKLKLIIGRIYLGAIFLFTISAVAQPINEASPKVPLPKQATQSKPTEEELLTVDAADTWHRNFVKAWNEWMLTKTQVPEFAKENKVLLQLFRDIEKLQSSNPVLAQTNSNIVNFVIKNKEPTLNSSTTAERHVLTIRILSWPKFLVNGNTFEYFEKKSLQDNYTLLNKNHHYKKLATQETKNEFALAALSYMHAMQKTEQIIKVGSKLRMQKPSAAQMAGAKGNPMNIPGMPEGVTMMNMGGEGLKDAPFKETLESKDKLVHSESWFQKAKEKFSQLWK